MSGPRNVGERLVVLKGERTVTDRDLAAMIDHTLLRPEACVDDIRRLCAEAVRYGFASVCVNGRFVELAALELASTGVKVCSVVGFPLGASSTACKVFEARDAAESRAAEVDMVLAVGLLRSGHERAVEEDIKAVVEAVRGRAIVKVILETCLLTDEQKMRACVLAERAGAHFVKTSTGFSSGGATEADVALLRRTVGDRLGVKASSGIRTRADAERMIAAGASRIGASASVAICGGAVS